MLIFDCILHIKTLQEIKECLTIVIYESNRWKYCNFIKMRQPVLLFRWKTRRVTLDQEFFGD